jgi:hypothetical protein
MGQFTGDFEIGYQNRVHPGNKSKDEKEETNYGNRYDRIPFCQGTHINCRS